MVGDPANPSSSASCEAVDGDHLDRRLEGILGQHLDQALARRHVGAGRRPSRAARRASAQEAAKKPTSTRAAARAQGGRQPQAGAVRNAVMPSRHGTALVAAGSRGRARRGSAPRSGRAPRAAGSTSRPATRQVGPGTRHHRAEQQEPGHPATPPRARSTALRMSRLPGIGSIAGPSGSSSGG